MSSSTPTTPPRSAAWIVFAAGVCAALHVGKLPPAIGALQQALGMTLLEAGFLLSLVQAAGMAAGIGFGVVADAMGLRRSMLLGLLLLAGASAAGAVAPGVPALLALRALEGFGFLLVVLPAPGLIRRLVAPQRLNVMLGVWGTYMPLGAALGLLGGPVWIAALGWRHWWGSLAALSSVMALLLWRGVADVAAPASAARAEGVLARLARTLRARGPWLVALTFAMYSSQWLAVIGFLPVIYTAAGVGAGTTGVLTALAAAVNMLGNLGAGRWLQRGVPPPRLLAIGFTMMSLAATAAFAGTSATGLPPALRYAAVLMFSMVGGMIPATLFALAMRLAPGEQTVSTTVGWMQQWSAFGQFAGPPLVAWLAGRAGGWHWTWIATAAASIAGLLLTGAIARTPPRSN
jgi:MFS transporter, CP family, cyanate transporter